MPMPVLQFRPGPGVLGGISAGQNIMQRFITDPTQARLLRQKSQELAEQLKVMPESLQAKLALDKLRPGYMQAQTGAELAGIPLTQQRVKLTKAQTDELRQIIKDKPEQFALAVYNAQIKARQAATAAKGAPGRELKYMGQYTRTPLGAAKISKDKQAARDFAIGSSLLLHQVANPGVAPQALPLPSLLSRFRQPPGAQPAQQPIGQPIQQQPIGTSQGGALEPGGLMEQLGRQALTPPGMQQPSLQQQLAQQQQPQDVQAAVPVPPEVTDDQIADIQRTAAAQKEKQVTTANILNQRYYAQISNFLLKNIMPELPQITQFAGLAGGFKRGVDGFKAAFGATDPRYIRWNNFAAVQMPTLLNEIRRKMGGQASDKELETLKSLTDITKWNENPLLALNQFYELARTSVAIDKALAKGAGETRTALGKSGQMHIPTVEETIKIAKQGASGQQPAGQRATPLTIPTFSSKSDFNKWYQGLSVRDKNAYRSSHAGGA